MTKHILWKDSHIVWRGGNIVWIDDADDPEDCECCPINIACSGTSSPTLLLPKVITVTGSGWAEGTGFIPTCYLPPSGPGMEVWEWLNGSYELTLVENSSGATSFGGTCAALAHCGQYTGHLCASINSGVTIIARPCREDASGEVWRWYITVGTIWLGGIPPTCENSVLYAGDTFPEVAAGVFDGRGTFNLSSFCREDYCGTGSYSDHVDQSGASFQIAS